MRKALQLLGVLSDVDIEWMATMGAKKHFEAGATMIHERTPIDSLYILLEGQLSVCVQALNGKEIAKLSPGEIVGEISFVDPRPPLASVIALRDSVVLALDRVMLSAKLAKDVGFAARFYLAIASFLADRLYVTTSRFGYGSGLQDIDPDELGDAAMEEVSLATVRFDKLLKRLRSDYMPKGDSSTGAAAASTN